MRDQFDEAIMRYLFMQNTSSVPYLILTVHRDNIVADTLSQVSITITITATIPITVAVTIPVIITITITITVIANANAGSRPQWRGF